jgi:hypothetical protein
MIIEILRIVVAPWHLSLFAWSSPALAAVVLGIWQYVCQIDA